MTEWVEGMVAVWSYEDNDAYLIEKIHDYQIHSEYYVIDFVKLGNMKRYKAQNMGAPNGITIRPITDEELIEYVKWRLIND